MDWVLLGRDWVLLGRDSVLLGRDSVLLGPDSTAKKRQTQTPIKDVARMSDWPDVQGDWSSVIAAPRLRGCGADDSVASVPTLLDQVLNPRCPLSQLWCWGVGLRAGAFTCVQGRLVVGAGRAAGLA
jgi:hypothetical protein